MLPLLEPVLEFRLVGLQNELPGLLVTIVLASDFSGLHLLCCLVNVHLELSVFPFHIRVHDNELSATLCLSLRLQLIKCGSQLILVHLHDL